MFYGTTGRYDCIFYSLHVAPSTTTSGRSCISAAGLLQEMFLANNVEFASLNEVVTFIDNVCNNETRSYDDKLILDRNISLDEVFFQLMKNTGTLYVPSTEDLNIVWEMLGNLSQVDLNRLYYKNNLYAFMDNKSMSKALIYILKELDEPILNPNYDDKNRALKMVKPELDELKALLKEYVYYPHQIIDRIDRYRIMVRKACVVTDTDSTICSFDAWYRFCVEKVKDIPMAIKKGYTPLLKKFERDEFGDIENLEPLLYKIDVDEDYDFYDDECMEIEASMNLLKVLPQEGLKHSIINIMAYCLGDIINDYMERYTMNSNSYEKGRKCLLNMKNEFEMKRMLLTGVMKNYASIIALQEGHQMPGGGKMDVKGLPLIKSTTNARTMKKLQEILYEEILSCEEIDQVKVLKELAKFEKEIYKSLNSGSKDFYSPVKIKSFKSYELPFRKYGIKQAIVWNELRGEQKPIDLEGTNTIDIVKLNINPTNVGKIKSINEEAYNKIIDLMNQKEFKNEITGIAVPLDCILPDYLIEFIDFTSIIHDNLSLFPIESIGIEKINKSNNYTNIIHI